METHLKHWHFNDNWVFLSFWSEHLVSFVKGISAIIHPLLKKYFTPSRKAKEDIVVHRCFEKMTCWKDENIE